MYTRSQVRFILLWLSIPFGLLILLMLINPVYEGKMFHKVLGIYGIELFLMGELINAFALLGGHFVINMLRRPRCDPFFRN